MCYSGVLCFSSDLIALIPEAAVQSVKTKFALTMGVGGEG